jgi:hypothetical protein
MSLGGRMIITSIIELLELLRSLVQRKGELDEKYFNNFILPAWEAFEKVPNNYKASLAEYTRILSDRNLQVSSLIDKIMHDSIQTADLRSQLYHISKNLPGPMRSIADASPIYNFVHEIDLYFAAFESYLPMVDYYNDDWRQEWLSSPDLVEKTWKTDANEPLMSVSYANFPRGVLSSYLIRYKGNEKSATRIINEILLVLQNGYARVFAEYNNLRKKLLA